MKKSVLEYTEAEFQEVMHSRDEPAFHGRQIFSWIYKKGAHDFGQMSDLPVKLRQKLDEHFTILPLTSAACQESVDGTRKFLFALGQGLYLEAVTIPAEKRLTACISSQAGCRFACRFCASGQGGFKRNLSTAEIIGQVLYLKNSSQVPLTHIVFMGTGEPLDNYDAVLKSVRIINAEYAFAIGARRITVSTCGIIPGIERLAGEGLQIELSVSPHAADEKIRTMLMPVNKAYPIKDLMTALRQYQKKTNRQITFEYILVRGINSDLQSARNLCTIVRGLDCKFNLIPVNPHLARDFQPPNKLDILIFKDQLVKCGIPATLRKPRGQDIEAACGQLRLRYEKP